MVNVNITPLIKPSNAKKASQELKHFFRNTESSKVNKTSLIKPSNAKRASQKLLLAPKNLKHFSRTTWGNNTEAKIARRKMQAEKERKMMQKLRIVENLVAAGKTRAALKFFMQ